MKTETMLMVLVAFVIGWFSRTMMSGLVEGIQAPSPHPKKVYDHVNSLFESAPKGIQSCARTLVKVQPDSYSGYTGTGALDAATQICVNGHRGE